MEKFINSIMVILLFLSWGYVNVILLYYLAHIYRDMVDSIKLIINKRSRKDGKLK